MLYNNNVIAQNHHTNNTTYFQIYTDINNETILTGTDGAKWLQAHNDNSLDIIFIDSSDDDDDGNNSSLFTTEFYQSVARALKKNGLVVKQSGCSFMQQSACLSTLKHLKTYFSSFGLYATNVPTYVGGDMSFAWGTNGTPLNKAIFRNEYESIKCVHYHPDLHKASFKMPYSLQRKIDSI